MTTECPGPLPPAPADGGVCEYTAGAGDQLLIVGTVLTPGEVLRGGQVLIDGAGDISCVGCDCSPPADAAQLACPQGVISPGLINTHDHITYVNNHPYELTDERFEHRHHWRRGLRGHTEVDYDGGASTNEIRWGELRMVLGGATSLNGSGSTEGFLRNLDRSDQEGLDQRPVEYSTFPLGDGDGTLLIEGCDYPSIERTSDISGEDAYTPHVAEGIDLAAVNEFQCLRSGSTDLVQEQSAFIHGVGLEAVDIAEMAVDGTDLIWSPRTNVTLYGDTARATLYHALGVRIALGTDWILTGSMNMVRELRCADQLNSLYMVRDDGLPYFSDEELWLMATRNAAAVLGVDDVVGTLDAGQAADIAIFDGRVNADHRAVIDAEAEDVVLVLRRTAVGASDRLVPLYGDASVVQALPDGDDCDALEVCGVDKAVCVSRETGGDESLASLSSANSDAYPLFFCAPPEGEPSCLPWRAAEPPLPDPEVNGSNRYTGTSTPDDLDGDGIVNDDDNCPAVFNPVRPMDGGWQADFDHDGVGDECDPCPLTPDATDCELPDTDDLDNDRVTDSSDNCPRDANPLQENSDGDDLGDACDLCPEAANVGGAPCPATIYDIKDPASPFAVGHRVALTGPIVTAVGPNGFFMQQDPSAAGADYSGIFVYTSTAPTVSVGDRVELSEANVNEYNCQVQLDWATVTVLESGVALPEPVEVTTAELVSGTDTAAALEGVLVEVTDATVIDDSPTPCMWDEAPGEFTLSDGDAADQARVDDFLYLIDPAPAEGEALASVTGVVALRDCCTKLLPRGAEDVLFGVAALGTLSPGLSYAWEGTTATTFPEPLTVSLTRAADSPVTVTFTTSAAGLTVDDVVIPAGATSAEVPVVADTASLTPYVVTANLDGDEATAQVRVVGPAETPALSDLQPVTATVGVEGTLEMTVTLDLPAPSGGVDVDLAVVGSGSIPATVTVPAEQLSAAFTYTAGLTAATDEVSATLGLDTLSSTITVVEGVFTGLVINEVDYDTVGTDSAEFVELYNGGATEVLLDGLLLLSFNGATNAEFDRYDLAGTLAPGEFLLLAGADVVVPADVPVVDLPNNSLQNGSPDGIALFDTLDDSAVDVLCWEGEVTAAEVDGVSDTLNLVEGTRTTAEDNNDTPTSLIRYPDGNDTDVAADDWSETTTPTPGLPNEES